MKELTNNTFEQFIAESDKTGIVEFYTPTCKHCKRMETVLEELENEQSDLAVFGRVDCANETALAARFDITAAPTLLIIKNGEIKDKLTGFTHKLILAETIKKFA